MEFLAEGLRSVGPVDLGGTFGDADGAAVGEFDELSAFAECLDFGVFDWRLPAQLLFGIAYCLRDFC